MSVKVDKLENNMAKLTIEVPAEALDKAINGVYQKTKNKISVPGFRKGKAPRNVIERMYGREVFYEDAANDLVREEYPKAADECGEQIVSNAKFDVVQIEQGLPFIFTAEVALRPPVSLGKYKGVSVEKQDTTLTAEEVDAEIERQRDLNGRIVEVTDRPVKDKDQIKLDFEGFVDGTAFEGGKGEDYPLTIGAGQFIPGFEEQLIGVAIGEEKDVNVTFPEDYHAADLKGKDALFHCKVNSIREKVLPELDDEYASDYTEFDTLDAYKEDIKQKLQEKKDEEARKKKEDEAVDQVVEDAEIDLPEPMIETQQQSMLNDLGQRLRMQGMDLHQYAQMMGMNVEQLFNQMKPQAIKRLKTRLVLDEIAKTENLEVSDEEFDKEFEKMAKDYGMTVERLQELMDEKAREQMRDDLKAGKAADLIVDNAKEKKATKKAKEKDAKEDAEKEKEE